MTEKSKRSQRKLFRITDATFQRQFTLFCLTIGSITSSIALIGLMFTIYKISHAVNTTDTMSWDQLQSLVSYEMRLAWGMTMVVTLLNLVVSALMSHFFSHRASGLVLRVTNTLNALADGRSVEIIRPRKNDFFLELVAAVNRLIEKKP